MKNYTLRMAAAAAVITVLPVTACSASGDNGDTAFDPTAPVTITVGEKPPAEQTEPLKAFNDAVARFHDKYPNITVKAEETAWAPATYQAMIAGGTMPTTLRVPLTEIQGLATRGQITDLTDAIAADKVASKLNPDLLANVRRDKRVYGVPVGAFTMGIAYNRNLYKEAGLDPDKPPSTWDELRENARTIKEKTGSAAALVTPTTSNFGGFTLTAMTYGMGGALEKDEGGKTVATIDSPAVTKAFRFLHDVRWKDDTFGSNFLLSADDLQRELGAGRVAQAVLAADRYNSLVVNWHMKPDDIGLAPLPQASNGIGTLAGGNISVVSPTATRNQVAAALKWIDFYYLAKYSDPEAAVADAKTRQASGIPNGSPEIPLFDEPTQKAYLESIAAYVDVPRENFTALLKSIGTLPLVPEPRVKAQQIYALLDSAVQAVLTQQDTDIPALVAGLNKQAQRLIDAQ